jgi:hypothetical protein
MLFRPFVASLALALSLAAGAETAKLNVTDGIGPSPKLPPPAKTVLPPIKVATAVGGPAGR